MTRYSSTMSEILSQIREGFSPKQIKMAIGIASDKRYKQGNYSGAVKQIEKIKKGLSDHPQVAAVLKRQNEEDEPASPDEGSMAIDQLEFMMHAIEEMKDHIENGGEFPEWMQNKLSGVHEKMKSLYANIEHDEMKEGVEPIQWPSQPLEEELDLDEKVEYVEYKFKNRRDAEGARDYFNGINLMSLDVNDDGIENGDLAVDAGKKDMTKYHKEVMKKYRPKVVTQEEVELDEMKMDDPKLVKAFDKMKKGDTIKLKTSSTISKGKDFVDYVVTAKNVVNKGKVEKVTLVTKGNEKAVKKFLYKRDGKVTFAIGDMGASIDDIKEGKSSTGYELYHKDFSSAMAHAYDFAKKKFGIEVDPKEIDDKVASGPRKPAKGKTNSYRLKGKDGKKAIQVQVYGMDNGKYELNMYKEETMKEAALMIAEKLKVSDGLGAWIDDFQKSDAPQFDGKSEEQKKKMAIAAFVDAGGKLESVKEEEEPKKPEPSDGAKAVAQARDDKKKTRIAQLQLQIAKATETINKLNAQEKPSE